MKIRSLFLISASILVFSSVSIDAAHANDETIPLNVSSGNCPSSITSTVRHLRGMASHRITRETFDVNNFVTNSSFERTDTAYVFEGTLTDEYTSCNSDTWFSTNTLTRRLTFSDGKLRLVYQYRETGGRWVQIPLEGHVFNNQFIIDVEAYRRTAAEIEGHLNSQ